MIYISNAPDWSVFEAKDLEKQKTKWGWGGGKKKKEKYLLFYLGYPSNPWTIKLCSGKLKLYHTSSQFILYINQLRSILAFTCYFLQCNRYNLFFRMSCKHMCFNVQTNLSFFLAFFYKPLPPKNNMKQNWFFIAVMKWFLCFESRDHREIKTHL